MREEVRTLSFTETSSKGVQSLIRSYVRNPDGYVNVCKVNKFSKVFRTRFKVKEKRKVPKGKPYRLVSNKKNQL